MKYEHIFFLYCNANPPKWEGEHRNFVMFFGFGLSGVFHVFCIFDHHQGEGARKVLHGGDDVPCLYEPGIQLLHSKPQSGESEIYERTQQHQNHWP